jgi:hypothetical protein
MYVKTVDEQYLHKRWNTQQIRHWDVFKCDECGKTYALGFKAMHATNGTLTFCSRVCNKKSRSSGKLAQQWKQIKLERYGVEFSSQVPGAGEKMIATRLARTGAIAPSVLVSTSNAKWRETMVERHGANHPSRAPSVKARKLETYRERYGVDNPLNVGSPFRDPNDAVKGGQVGYRALLAKHGDSVLSKPEALLAAWLREKYVSIDQQVPIDHGGRKPWLIDAYVRQIDTYVELDGVFWHGLDLPYDKLHESKRRKYDADRAQDEWFRSHGLRLVRVTDKELAACQQSGDWSDIVTKLGG